MYWKFVDREKTDGGSGAIQNRMIIEHGKTISAIEVFVREVLQNCLDAALLAENGTPRQVRVHFRLRKITGQGEKKRFLALIGWGALKQHVDACNRLRAKQQLLPMFPLTGELEKNAIHVLEVCDFNTIGLTGPEAVGSESEEIRKKDDPVKAFFALVRDDARREKQGLGAGGTYGLGKAVLWASSRIQTVLFFSRLSKPFEGVILRAAGQARLHAHYVADRPFTGVGYGGERDGSLCWAIRDNPARDWAASLGLEARGVAEQVGTTILIPFWERPVVPRGMESLPDHVLIARFAARYFWPAITDGRLSITAESESGKIVNADEYLDPFSPFIELYQRVRAKKSGRKDIAPEKIKFIVPPLAAMGYKESKETFALAAMCEIGEATVGEDFCRRVACIRGQGMVIGYWPATGTKVVKPYVGLALGGRAIDTERSGVYGDLLLGFSEGVTHTEWSDHSPSLKDWREAVTPIRRLLQALQKYFEEHSAPDVGPLVEDLSALEEGLTFPGPGVDDENRDWVRGLPILDAKPLVRGDRRYQFEVHADITDKTPDVYIDVIVAAGLESGGASPDDRFVISKLHTRPSLKWERVRTKKGKPLNKIRIYVPRQRRALKIKISGETEQLNRDLFNVSQGVLHVIAKKEQDAEAVKNETEQAEAVND
jgi:hypothetical protein